MLIIDWLVARQWAETARLMAPDPREDPERRDESISVPAIAT